MKNIPEELALVWQQMLSGEVYDALHPRLVEMLAETREKIYDFNNLRPSQKTEQMAILRELLGRCGENLTVNQPFRCDYGRNISIGDNVFINFNMTILDEAEVTIGNNVFIGPNVSIYTPCHPLVADERNAGVEWAEPVTIGNDVWIGGNAVILPGVTIGDGAVVGAGSVVSRDVPEASLVVGCPAHVVRKLSK